MKEDDDLYLSCVGQGAAVIHGGILKLTSFVRVKDPLLLFFYFILLCKR